VVAPERAANERAALFRTDADVEKAAVLVPQPHLDDMSELRLLW
jgi:hypothetical protein